jgi:opacity protein-like surface antigen
MKKSIILIICIFTFYRNAFTQTKWEYGIKITAYQCDSKLYEFTDPFPFYKKDFGDNFQQFYGSTIYTVGYNLGFFINYPILKNGRIKLNSEINLNTRGYNQQDNSFNENKIHKTYLDLPINIKFQPFYKAGVFVETGIYKAFILSNKTKFPATNANSSEFEKRRSRANTREINLFGFNVGVGYEFKKFDVAVNYRVDKQYEYIGLGFRFKLPELFK